MYLYLCICIFVFLFVYFFCVFVFVYLNLCICIFVFVFVYLYLCICICVRLEGVRQQRGVFGISRRSALEAEERRGEAQCGIKPGQGRHHISVSEKLSGIWA